MPFPRKWSSNSQFDIFYSFTHYFTQLFYSIYTRAEREARCTTSSDSTLLADSELVFEFCVRPHMTEKIDF